MSDWIMTEQTWCTQCWKQVGHPCVTACGPLRDASECQELLQLPRTKDGRPIRKRTRVSIEADLNLHREEEPVPEHLMRQFAPNFPKAR